MSEPKDSQMSFSFDGFEERPHGILGPEDDSLLDFDSDATPDSEDGDDSVSWDEESFDSSDGEVASQDEEPPPLSNPEEDSAPQLSSPKKSPLMKPVQTADMRRAALAWLASLNPLALASKVPTRLKRFQADAAAFWAEPGKKRLLKPTRTILVEVRHDRENCWPECSRKDQLLPSLREAKARKSALEAEIRSKEPSLKDSDVLFEEVPRWDYSKSSNKSYHRCLRQIEDIERALYNGSRFERIRRAKVANELYLAVPEGAVHPYELADGWGLLYISKDLKTSLVKSAAPWECPEENHLHLAQNIAASSMRDVLFANGVFTKPDGSITLIRPPRRRRPQAALSQE